MLTLTAILFVGGQSRRMGLDKATMEIAGEPLWRRQLRVLGQLAPQATWISARTRPAWCPAEVQTLLDEAPFCGPLSGLAVALGCLNTTHLLALAVDLPCMNAKHLSELWRSAGASRGVVPWRGDFFEPLCAIYPREAAPHAQAQLRAGNGSLQRLVQSLQERELIQAHSLSGAEATLYHNMNTPGQVPLRPDSFLM